jgi:hypothetical protein
VTYFNFQLPHNKSNLQKKLSAGNWIETEVQTQTRGTLLQKATMKGYLLQEPVLLIYTLFERLLDAKCCTVPTQNAKEQIRLL